VTTQDFSENQSSPVAMYVDEVYKSVGAVQALQIYDLDRVEVLRGPQARCTARTRPVGDQLLLPESEPHGLRRLRHGRAGNYSDYSVRGAVGGPIVENGVGWRVALLYEKRDGWCTASCQASNP